MRGMWRLQKMRGDLENWLALRRALHRVGAFPTADVKRRHELSTQLIVSVTSYPPRFSTLHLSLRSLLDQRIAADRTILWLAESDQAQLPKSVTDLIQYGLEVRTCRDLRSYKKLIPALINFPDATIVTADDDVYYSSKWLENLLFEARRHPEAVIGHRAHLARLNDDGSFARYDDWQFDSDCQGDASPMLKLFLTGVGGILYPPRCLDDRVVETDTFMRLCPAADDIWFFWMAMLAGTSRRKTPARFHLVPWEDSQNTALFHQNWLGQGNDAQIRALEAHFGKLGGTVNDGVLTTSNHLSA